MPAVQQSIAAVRPRLAFQRRASLRGNSRSALSRTGGGDVPWRVELRGVKWTPFFGPAFKVENKPAP
jgi:hypothetical protein